MSPTSDVEARHRLIVGVDFGTTFTGISFAMTTDNQTVYDLEQWPTADVRRRSISAPKTPTRIAYVPGLASRPWGYQVRDSRLYSCAWMKYHLDSEAAESRWDDPELREEMKRGLFRVSPREDGSGPAAERTAEEVTTEYLTEVFRFAVKQLEGEYSSVIMSLTGISFWLTRPAMWGVQAMHKLKAAVQKAARDAKFPGARNKDEFGLIAEPEAAAFTITADPEYDIEDGIKVPTEASSAKP